MLTKIQRKLTLGILILLLSLSSVNLAAAQGSEAYALINEVNALRAAEGLQAYSIDAALMASAQAHAEYMASLGTWTHSRADGSTAASLGIAENVAMGMQLTPNYAVYTLWTDASHWPTMVGHSGGSVGAGVATDGSNIYYVLNVLPSGQNLPDNRAFQDNTGVKAVQPIAVLRQNTLSRKHLVYPFQPLTPTAQLFTLYKLVKVFGRFRMPMV